MSADLSGVVTYNAAEDKRRAAEWKSFLDRAIGLVSGGD